MDSRDHRQADQPNMSVIGADIVVTGNIEASVDILVEGRVVGDVRCATLILGERSSIVGSIFAERVRVSGIVEGAIETQDLAVEASATVKGEIIYERLKVASGGTVEGKMTHRVTEQGERLKLIDQIDMPETPVKPTKVHYIE